MKLTRITSACIILLGWATAVVAADTPTKTTHSPESIECSKQADAKGLHGKERKKFRAECKKELKAKAGTKTPGTPAPTPAAKAEAPATPAAKTEAPAATPKN
jgi:hypothetical protein